MSFKSSLNSLGLQVFLNADEFAEEISYTPDGESAKTIKAIIEREQLESSPQDRHVMVRQQARIRISKDSTYGVSVVTKGADKLSFPVVLGQEAVDWVVDDIIDSRTGMWHLSVGR